MVSPRTLQKMIARAQTEELRGEVRKDREQVKAARSGRRARLQAISAQCRAAREAHTSDAKRRRAALRASIEHARDVIRNRCAKARGRTDEETAAELLAAMGELHQARERLALHLAGIQLPPKDPAKVRAGLRRAELLQEEIEAVSTDLEGAGMAQLVPVWQNVARRLPKRYRATAERSALEGFLEWAEEHAGDVADIQDRLLDRSIRDIEARELDERRAMHDAAAERRERKLRALIRTSDRRIARLEDGEAMALYEDVIVGLQQAEDPEIVEGLKTLGAALQRTLVSRGVFEQDAPPLSMVAEAPF